MDLHCNLDGLDRYRSGTRVARVVSERWLGAHMYCPACSCDSLVAAPNNAPGIDFTCPRCPERYQLKSRKSVLANRIVDSAYEKMVQSINSDQSPNLVLLQYSAAWTVSNLLLVPHFFFTTHAIERRKPLGPAARRAGWVGCNILLDKIAPDGRIPIVEDGVEVSKSIVRAQFDRVRAFKGLNVTARGWTLEVLSAVRKLNKTEFTLADVYSAESDLQTAYPANSNVKPKIRQQLQVLRDMGYLTFEGAGRYRLIN